MYNCEGVKSIAKTQQIVLKTPKQFLQEIKKNSIENVEINEEIKSFPEPYRDNIFFNVYNSSCSDDLSTDVETENELDTEDEISEDEAKNTVSTSYGEINNDEIAQNPSVLIERNGNEIKRIINLCYFEKEHNLRSCYVNNGKHIPIVKPKKRGRKRMKVICSTCNKNVVKDIRSDGKPYRTCEKCKQRKKNSYLKKHMKDSIKTNRM